MEMLDCESEPQLWGNHLLGGVLRLDVRRRCPEVQLTVAPGGILAAGVTGEASRADCRHQPECLLVRSAS